MDKTKVIAAIFIIALICVFFIGCSQKSSYVFVPQRCSTGLPIMPQQTNDTLTDVKNIVIYTQELECYLDFCVNGKISKSYCK